MKVTLIDDVAHFDTMRKILGVLLAMGACVCASAKTYWCSPDGVSDGSSYGRAGSFEVLVSGLAAGDTLYLRGGQYDSDHQINISCCGTSDRRIVLIGCPGEKPVLDFRRQPYGRRGLVIVQGADWLHLCGLTVRYAGKNGVHNSGSHNIFERLDVYGNGDSGIQMKAGGDNLILNCDSHDNFDYRLQGDFGGNADGFADKQYTGGGNTYIGCRSWNNSDDGWDFYQRVNLPGTETVLIDCICYQNGPYEYDMRGHARYGTDREWFDSFADGQTVMFRNGAARKVTLEHYYNNGNRNGFKLGGDRTDCNVHLIGCIAVGNYGKGFDQNSNAGNMTLEKCRALANASDFNFYRKECGRLAITDCVTIGGEHRMECLEVHESGNSWNNPDRQLKADDFVSLDTTLILLPRQPDGSLQQTGFLTLRDGPVRGLQP